MFYFHKSYDILIYSKKNRVDIMEFVTNIFIETYHVVKKVIDFPKDTVNKIKQRKMIEEKKEEDAERNRRKFSLISGRIR